MAQLLTRAAEWEALIRYDPVERVCVRLADGNVEAWLADRMAGLLRVLHVSLAGGVGASDLRYLRHGGAVTRWRPLACLIGA